MTKRLNKYIMFKSSKYSKWYYSVINSAIRRNRSKSNGAYYERHHIIPRSLGGDDTDSNLVLLTAKEHFVCHHLLIKMTAGTDRSKMVHAFWSMSNAWGRINKPRITSNVYEQIRKEIALIVSANNKGKVYPVSEEARQKISASKMGDRNPMFGKPAPNRGQRRPGVGGRKKGTKWSDSERDAQIEARSRPGHYDYLKSPDRRQKISSALKGKPGIAKGKTWFNDGNTECYAFEAPSGFAKGRLQRLQVSKRGMKWYNNGKINKQFRDNEVEEGFVRGRLSNKKQ